MKMEERVLGRLDELLQLGQRVLATRRSPPPNVCDDDSVDMQLAHQWVTSAQAFLATVLTDSSRHFKNFTKLSSDQYLSYSPISQAYGVLEAAKDDLNHGGLIVVKTLVEAELFDEFIEQSEHLLSAGYYQAAAVIAGAVLEDALRKLCAKHNITVPAKPKLDSMNAELAKAGAYNTLTQKRITALADIRNTAAHGKWDQFTQADVTDMVDSIRRFMELHFS